jgi:hypothetical protein
MPAPMNGCRLRKLIPAINKTGPELGLIEEFIYRWYIIPTLRDGLLKRRTRLFPLLRQQPPWGTGPRRHLQSVQADPGRYATRVTAKG